jgi:hypothetical protein
MYLRKVAVCFLLLVVVSLSFCSACFAQWNPADYTAFLTEQIAGENQIRVSSYSTWLGPETSWPIATDDESEGGAWKTTVSAYDENETLLGYIDVPQSAGGLVDYSAYVSRGIRYIKVLQGSGAESEYLEIVISKAGPGPGDVADSENDPGSSSGSDSGSGTGSENEHSWGPADYTVFLTEQIAGKNQVRVSTYSTWLGPDSSWPIATDDDSEGGRWKATVSAYDENKILLGYLDVPQAAGGVVDYSAYVSRGIKYIRVTQPTGAESGYLEVAVNKVGPDSGGAAGSEQDSAPKASENKDPNFVDEKGAAVGEIDNSGLSSASVSGCEEIGGAPFVLVFDDVRESDWFYGPVAFAVQNGLFTGTGTTTFSPNEPLTRAMLVNVLHRLAGSPQSSAATNFDDVDSGAWYAAALAWVAANDLVSGYGHNLFGPNDNITREQLATMLYRYAGEKGYDLSAGADLQEFKDAGSVSAWALDKVKWAVGSGLIRGKGDGILDPLGSATRAEAAAIMQQFIKNCAHGGL